MQSSEMPTETDESKSGKPRHKHKKRFGMEYRDTPEYTELFKNDSFWAKLFGDPRRWRKHYSWYATAKQRDQAMSILASRKAYTQNFFMHEYRPIER